MLRKTLVVVVCLVVGVSSAYAHEEGEVGEIPEVVVEGRQEDLVGIAESAAQGQISGREIETRPLLRAGEILEAVPGVVVTQHSGSGKANQYFLRGFNLDHGTDFAITVDGMPVNMRTHAHGQGYSDLNFIIPELVQRIDYKKGVYYAEEGDFANAGAANFHLVEKLDKGLAEIGAGKDEYTRLVTADSVSLGDGKLLLGLELQRYNGPWELEEEFRKYNALIRYREGDHHNGFNLTFMGYNGIWNSADQIPNRAVESGALSRLGNLDPTDGGRSARYSLSGNWRREKEGEKMNANIYAIAYRLNLYSNFTFFLDDPENGDQFAQIDRRVILGGDFSDEIEGTLFGRDTINTFGVQLRNDIIPTVALNKTDDRQQLSVVRNDHVVESSVGVYARNETPWNSWMRTVTGLRGDLYYFDVDSDNDANSGDEVEGKISPKGTIVFGPWSDTEFYLNGGLGFHSNDARGTTISVDPATGDPAEQVDPLVLARGAEVGVRTGAVPDLNSTLSLWILDLSSELLFVGDAGVTEASRASRRYGIELANYWTPLEWLKVDADLAFSNARFRDDAPEGDHIPGAIETAITGGITADFPESVLASVRTRYFGQRPLIEDNSVRSHSTLLWDARAGYHFGDALVALDLLNIFDSADHDIDYFYASRLPGEPEEGIEDIHFHPVEPFTVRLSVSMRF